jgi:hypothetical protein
MQKQEGVCVHTGMHITLSAQHSGHMSALAAVDSKVGG